MLKFVLPLIATSLVVLLGLSLDPTALRVTATTVPPQDTTTIAEGEIHAPGRVEGLGEEAELRPELAGRVIKIAAREGEVVEAGAVLLELDSQVQQHDVALAAAELSVAQAELDRLINGARDVERRESAAQEQALVAQLQGVRTSLDRVVSLRATNNSSQQQVDDLRAEKAVLESQIQAAACRRELIEAPAREDETQRSRARIAVAKARLDLARSQLEKMSLRAPHRGMVLEWMAQLGEMASSTSTRPALVFADTTRLCVRAFVEEFDAPRMGLGMQCRITADGLPGQTFSGRLARLSPRMNSKLLWTDDPSEQHDTKVREVWIEMDDAGQLPIGLRVDVVFSPQRE